MKIGVIVARFQSPDLSQAQKVLINKIKTDYDQTVIVLGVSPLQSTPKNPFDFETRKSIIQNVYPDIPVVPLKDHPSDEKWSANLDQMLENNFPHQEFIIYGSKDKMIPLYSGRNHARELPPHHDYMKEEFSSGSETKLKSSIDFREGMLHVLQNQYKKVFPTVDIAVFRNNKTHLLLARKAISTNWRFPGGFSDPDDESYEAAALREMREECGELEVENLKYEFSARVPDWRYKNEDDKIITSLFSCDLKEGEISASDDINELSWFSLQQIAEMKKSDQLTPEHHLLFAFILDKYKNAT